MKSTACNIHLLRGELIIEELYRLGVEHVCIAPGSRSTPLVLAAKAHAKLRCHYHFDERGLGFYALGLAKYQQQAVAVITTSGSAVANLLPAVVEAHQNKTPLIILSADRPDELINCGANQAIEQQCIFSHYAPHNLNISADEDLSAAQLLTQLDQIISKQLVDQGVVHINCMFREPFYPMLLSKQCSNIETKQEFDASEQLDELTGWLKTNSPLKGKNTAKTDELAEADKQIIKSYFEAYVENKPNTLIIFAQREFPDLAADQKFIEWATQHNLPIFFDCQSSLSRTNISNAVHYYDQLLHTPDFKALLSQVDLIIQFGGRLISKRLQQFIDSVVSKTKTEKATYWLVSQKNQILDPDNNLDHRFYCHAEQLMSELAQQTLFKEQAFFKNQAHHKTCSWLNQLRSFDEQISQWLKLFSTDNFSTLAQQYCSEFMLMQQLPKLLPNNSCLFLSNSMPVRLYDMFALPQEKQLNVHTNRGASGIDGILATAIGIANQHQHYCHVQQRLTAKQGNITTLVIGDTALLHDLNSLALTSQLSLETQLIIIVLNNDGGAIFNLLPTPEHDNIKETLYQMPHGLNFAHACQMFNINYQAINNFAEFEHHYQTALSSPNSLAKNIHLFEVIVPSEQTTNTVKEIGKQLSAATLL